MSATVVPLPPNPSSETTDFLRRMASMVSGRNGEMLLRAAGLIESLTQRAMSAERLYHREHEENTRNSELREAGEMASDAMVKQIDGLRSQLAEVAAAERAAFDAERGNLLGLMQHAESHIGQLTSELETLHASVDSFNETAISVPIEVLRLARTQFDFLSAGFARKGDVISQAMSEIGGFAIDQALTVKKADPA
jgi:hypothetical protein